MCLLKESVKSYFKIREDLMSTEFPSIWLEFPNENKKSLVVGFHREWSHYGDNTEIAQSQRLDIFTNQIDMAAIINKSTCAKDL